MPLSARDLLPIGAVAARTGLSVSAIRFYEEAGLIAPSRNNGGQRRFLRSDIRRLSFIRIAQQLGFTLEDIRTYLAHLPDGRTPTKADWAQISTAMRSALDERITQMQRLRDKLNGCIGCGCLSLESCAIYNPDDSAAAIGSGARWVLGERASNCATVRQT